MAIKNKMVEHIDDIIKAHEKHQWLLDFTINGVLTKDNEKELWLSDKQCECGTWLNMRRDWIVEFFGNDIYSKLYSLHKSWHIELYKIREIYDKSNRGFIKKIVGTKRLADGDLDIAKAYYDDAKKISNDFIKLVKTVKTRAEHIPSYRYDEFEDKRKQEA